MTDIATLNFVFNGIMALLLYFMKNSHDQVRESLVEHKAEIKELRDTTYKKEDFRDFRDELYARLDKLEANLVKNSGNH